MRSEYRQLLREITAFCKAQNITETTFGAYAVNNGHLVARLRNGGRIWPDTVDRLRLFMARWGG